jgi:hypothetical protein
MKTSVDGVKRKYAVGESTVHDLTNIGKTPLSFVTVEFLDSANHLLSP